MKKIYATIIVLSLFSCGKHADVRKAEGLINIEEIASDISILSADSFLGRGPFTIGEKRTLEFLEKRMVEIGLEPVFEGDYFQKVPLVEIESTVPQKVVFNTTKGSKEVLVGEDITLWSPSLIREVKINESPLVFVGYGINSPELGWNDFGKVDVKGKTIVVLVNDPGFATGDSSLFNGRSMTYYGRWRYKFEEAERQGAAGCIIVHEQNAAGYPWLVVNGGNRRSDIFLDDESIENPACKLHGWIKEEAAMALFESSGYDYSLLKEQASRNGFLPVDLNASLSVNVKNKWKKSQSSNVAGFIKGKVKPDEVLVYCAHWDHLGVGTPLDGDSIYNGASDNAAAIAWMFGIAKAMKSVEGSLNRSVLFLSPTAEESGMLGSEYFVKNPPFAPGKMVSCFNYDVVLFLGKFKDVTITGPGHSNLDSLLEVEAKVDNRYVCSDPNPENGMFYRSDHLPFVKAGVPSLFAKGYSHQVELGREKTLEKVEEYWRTTYHKPSDHYIPEKHNLEGLVDDSRLFFRLGFRLANEYVYPEWSSNSEFFVDRFEH
ncbi:MAG TPA: M28 family peptidase [Tenuifilaceae bacterium]|nr:M28 family peptidase [Tenuifilaceae bacterium]HPE17833.1 M28 family peptidase [Tenuifilaceae bacterium]HPJ45269.1 M28 family peptidase [Tenuifilaceae bacterium]HPQ33617.1 M28 family peptidase [Tenuifilaceae bacterium]HRX67317.1 M28 family peptidase [Tenuifilaceae bacterium]